MLPLFPHFHSAMTVLVEPYRVKNYSTQYIEGVNDEKLKERRTKKKGRNWSSPSPHFSFDYKNVAH